MSLFPASCASSPGFYGAHLWLLALEYMVLVVEHVTALVMSYVMRGIHEIARAS